MRPLELGLALATLEDIPSGAPNTWESICAMARRAEEMGFDTVWFADEFLWKVDKWPGPRGFWESASLAGALAASTSKVGIGSWVFSAVHRNPALTVRIAETLDEISGGRFILGFGAGHDGNSSLGYRPDQVVSRYEEALQIVVPMIREGYADFLGRYHQVDELPNRPRGPRPGGIPLMLAGNRPRTISLAARYGDIWSTFATAGLGGSAPQAFAERVAIVEEACTAIGRETGSLRKSVSVMVQALPTPDASEIGFGETLSGDPDRLADVAHQFAEMGFTSLELSLVPESPAALEAVGRAVELLDA